jgi:hypothetical protein
MKRDTVMSVLQLVSATRATAGEALEVVRTDALQVGDRNVLEHALSSIGSELDTVAATLADMLLDPSRVEP